VLKDVVKLQPMTNPELQGAVAACMSQTLQVSTFELATAWQYLGSAQPVPGAQHGLMLAPHW
jgi:hypothetical protein